MKHSIGYARNGVLVYVDLIRSEAAKHIAQQPYLLAFVEEALRNVALRDPNISIEHNMQRPIGYDFVVDTTDKDTVFYAQPLRDTVYTRFVKSGKPAPTQYLSLLLQRDGEDAYELLDTWIGHISPPRPGSANETAESKPYWSRHAIILDNLSIQSRTLTKVCPYTN